MDEFFPFFSQTYIDPAIIAFRLALALLLGGAIGWEREYRRQNAGLRTHILICLGATLLMLTSIFIPQSFPNFKNGDPGRIAAQVVSGIGFLGAGAIFRLGANVRGLTTAASIWVVAAVGLTIGAGAYTAALLGTTFILFTLVVLDKVETRFFPAYTQKMLQLGLRTKKIETDRIFGILEGHGIRVQSLNISQAVDRVETQLKIYVQMPNQVNLKSLYKQLNGLEHLAQITLSHDF